MVPVMISMIVYLVMNIVALNWMVALNASKNPQLIGHKFAKVMSAIVPIISDVTQASTVVFLPIHGVSPAIKICIARMALFVTLMLDCATLTAHALVRMVLGVHALPMTIVDLGLIVTWIL